jgi:hypothetical protein
LITRQVLVERVMTIVKSDDIRTGWQNAADQIQRLAQDVMNFQVPG